MELPNNEPADKRVPENDISLNELIEMGKRYLLIPLGLLFVEIIYSIPEISVELKVLLMHQGVCVVWISM